MADAQSHPAKAARLEWPGNDLTGSRSGDRTPAAASFQSPFTGAVGVTLLWSAWTGTFANRAAIGSPRPDLRCSRRRYRHRRVAFRASRSHWTLHPNTPPALHLPATFSLRVTATAARSRRTTP